MILKIFQNKEVKNWFDHMMGNYYDCSLCRIIRWAQYYMAFKFGIILGLIILKSMGWLQ